MFGVRDGLKITVCKDADDAIEKGYDYNTHNPVPKGLELVEAVVVQNGTVQGNPTVDLILRDEEGNTYVALVKGRLLKMLPI